LYVALVVLNSVFVHSFTSFHTYVELQILFC